MLHHVAMLPLHVTSWSILLQLSRRGVWNVYGTVYGSG